MKILFVTCWYPHKGYPHRGIFIKEHARAAARAGHDVRVFHIWAERASTLWELEERHLEEEDLESFSFVIHSRLQRYIYGNTPLMQYLGLHYFRKTVLPRFVPDLIQGNVIYQAGMIARRLARYLSSPYVISEHWSKLDWYFGNPLLSYGARKAYAGAELLMPVSEFLAGEVAEYAGEQSRIEVIPNVVDTEQFYYTPKNGGSTVIELLMVMNYRNSMKRPELLLKALGALPAELQRKFRLLMVGRGNGKVEKESYRSGLGVRAEVRFLGELDKKEVAQKMREADYLVHPSEMETFGVVPAEALCCGLPCVASRVGALPERLDRDSGLLLDNSVTKWKEVLRDIAEGRSSFDRSAIAEKNSGRYSYESVGERLSEAYRSAMVSARG